MGIKVNPVSHSVTRKDNELFFFFLVLGLKLRALHLPHRLPTTLPAQDKELSMHSCPKIFVPPTFQGIGKIKVPQETEVGAKICEHNLPIGCMTE
jgi:hypothetical protein